MNTLQNKSSGVPGSRRNFLKRTLLVRFKLVLCTVLLILAIGNQKIFGQGVGISESAPITPNASSILELQSTTKGFLAPRMSTAQRTGLVSPAPGLLVYDTDTKSFWYYDSGWKAVAAEFLGVGQANQLLGVNAAGTANEYKTLIGTLHQITVTHTPGLITLTTPQNIDLTSTPTFAGLTLTSPLTVPNGGTGLTSGISGGIPYFNTSTSMASSALLTANGVVIGGGAGIAPSAITPGTNNTVLRGSTGGAPSFGQIVNSDIAAGTIDLTSKVTGVLPLANGGTNANLTASASNGGIVWSNANQMQILAGTTTANKILLSGASSSPAWSSYTIPFSFGGAGEVLYTSNATTLSSLAAGTAGMYLKSNGSAAPSWQRISLSSAAEVMNVLPVVNGGTNSSTALVNGRVIVSRAGQIVEAGVMNNGQVIVGSTGLEPQIVTMGGDITIDNAGTTAIGTGKVLNGMLAANAVTTNKISDGTIMNADINASAAIDATKLIDGTVSNTELGYINTLTSNAQTQLNNLGTQIIGINTLADGKIYLGDATNTAQEVFVTGDITMTDAGVTTISNNAVTTGKILDGTIMNSDINASAAIDATKLIDGTVSNTELGYINTLTSNAQTQLNNLGIQIIGINTLADGKIYLGDATNTAQEVFMTGDITMTDAGVTTISNGAVTTGKILDGTILTADIADANITNVKLADNSVTTNKITDGEVKTADIADANVTTTKIADANVTNLKLADNSVTTVKISDANVTVSKLGTSGVPDANRVYTTNATGVPTLLPISIFTSSYLLNGEIYIGDAANNAVGRTMSGDATISNSGLLTISNDAVTSAKISDGTIVNVDVAAAAAIDATKLIDGSVTNTELGYINTLTSNAQTQIDSKANTSGQVFTGAISATNLSGANNGDVTLAGQNYLSILGQVITANPVDLSGTNATGILAAPRFPSLTGDVTTTAGSLATTISPNAVAYGKMQAVSTTSRLLGSSSTTTAVQELTIGSGLTLSGNTLTSDGLGGTVTSVGLSLPPFITVTNSPVNGSGVLTGTLASQSANAVFAAPDGSAGVPTFRSLIAADVPVLDWSKITTGKPTTLAGYGITDAALSTHNHTVDGLINVTITGKANNDILQWNGSAWVNKTLTGAGIITSETDPIVKAINGIVKSNGTTISAAVAGTDYVVPNTAITGATKTKITYDGKGLVTAGADATTADISSSMDKNYVTDAQLVVISNTSGINSGDNAANTTANTYADTKVADVITNGVTTIAPSENAVFDALALKTDANATIAGATKTKITYDGKGLVTAGVDATATDIVNTAAGNIASTNVQAAINELDAEKVIGNAAITGATKTKITYDTKGLVTAGADATTADISSSTDKNYVTDAQLVVISNTSGINSGDNAANTTANTYADTKVADVITNGVTTIAPSENAVFDALALKAATNQTFYLGTTQIGIDRTSASQSLTGISIDGNAATATSATTANSATTAGTATNLSGGAGGSIPYQTGASTTTFLAAGSAGQILRSNGAAAPTWSTATYPGATSINRLLYSSAANTIIELATSNNGVLVTDGSGAPSITSTLPTVNLPAGTMILLNASEPDVSNTVSQTGAVTYNLSANTYSRILVETEVTLQQAGGNDANWNFTISFGGTAKETIPLRAMGSSVSHAHYIGTEIKFSEAYAAGGTISIDVTSVSQNGTWFIRGFRVYGIK